MDERIKRYPSIRAFQKNEASLFMGRAQEIKLLFNKVVAEKIMLLFARSGIGKSSLINAGLVPMLEERGFLPLYVRLSSSEDPTDTPIQIFQKLLDHYLDKQDYEKRLQELKTTNTNYKPGLWEYFKCCSFPLASTPVLIFDQFEQFFSFSVPVQNEFLQQFKNILYDSTPPEFLDWYNELTDPVFKTKYSSWLGQPDLRVLFAIRSDKIFEMNRLSQFIPNILRNRFELYPLEEGEAKNAITSPAEIKNKSLYLSDTFGYEETLLTNIITRLKGGNDIIETTQLQIICSEIESHIILAGENGESAKPEGYEVKASDLDKIGGIENIVSNFYQNQVKMVGDEKKQELVKILIEDNLYDKDARTRKLAFKEAALNILAAGKKKLGITDLDEDQFINKLLSLRLIREDYRENRKFYEISHDYLLNAITESFQVREAKRLAEKNADLQKRYNELKELKDRAVKSEETAYEKQKEAEQATKIAYQAKDIATAAVLKVVKFKKRNERLAIAIFIIAIFGIAYLANQNRLVKQSRARIEKLNIRATKGLISIFSVEAEKRYTIGDRMVAYALWDSARTYYDPQDSTWKSNFKNRSFPPFTATSTETDIQVSKDLNYVCTKYTNLKFISWKINEKDSTVEKMSHYNSILNFLMLPNNKVIVIDTSYTPFYINLSSDSSKHRIPTETNSKFYDIELLDQSNLIILNEKNGENKYFFSIDDFHPIPELNNLYKKYILPYKSKIESEDQNAEEVVIDYFPLDKNNLLINVNNSFYYLSNLVDKNPPIKLFLPANTGVVVGNASKKIAYNSGGHLKIFDLLTLTTRETEISLGKYDIPREFFCNDSLILVEHYKNHGDDKPSLSIYNINNPEQNPVFPRNSYSDLSYSKDMNMVGFLDKEKGLILFDAVARKIVYPVEPGLPADTLVSSYNFYKNSNEILLYRNDGKVRILTSKPNSPITAILVEFNGNSPFDVYGDTFYKYREGKTRKYVLEFQDSTRNNIQSLRKAFQKYTDNEIKKVIGD